MILSASCTLAYQVISPTAAFSFNVLAHDDAAQRVVRESIVCTPAVPTQIVEPEKGGRVLRCEAPAGAFEFRYAAAIEVNRPPLPAAIAADNPGRLPLNILTYLLPSRYCESDRFSQIAWELFGQSSDRAEQVRAVCRWVDDNVAYTPGASDARTSAWDTWQSRKGVCRDYTHLAVALCRALSIPARYVGCYAAGLTPMDFHACFEAYLGGGWRLFDPADNIAPNQIAVISRGRDATSAALTTIFGKVTTGPVKVACEGAAELAIG